MTILQVVVPSTSLKQNFRENFLLDNEILFGEQVKVIDELKSWYLCETLIDQYKGWVLKKDLSETLKKSTHRVINIRTNIYKAADEKSNIFFYLPLGSKITVINHDDKWATINFEYKKKQISGYIPLKHLVSKDHKVTDWVTVAEQFLNIPYKWGGRDSFGIDCSALIQLSLETIGINFPRDTNLQILYKKHILNNNIIKRGSLIFWNGHVGVMVDKYKILHSNAFHMKTNIESLKVVVKRSENLGYPIKKIMNFKYI